MTDVHDREEVMITAERTFDLSKAWPNPMHGIPLEKAHLSIRGKSGDEEIIDPYTFEQLCVQHDLISPC